MVVPLLATSVRPVFTLLSVRPAKVATPALTVAVVVPERVVPAATPVVGRLKVIVEVASLVSTLPLASSMATWTEPMVTPAVALVGWVTKASWVEAPGVTVKAAEVAGP